MSSETYNKLAEYRKNKAKSTKTCAIIESQPKHSNQNSSNLHVRTLNLIFHPLDRFLLKPLGYNLVHF